MKNIIVALATYNGEKYIKEQLLSLGLLQEKAHYLYNFTVLVSDDGSTDNTIFEINEVVKNTNLNLVVVNAERLGGVKENFKFLISIIPSDSDYIFFCDQDDFWLPNKIDLFMNEFLSCAPEKPVLVHSDLCVVDRSLSPLHHSMFKYQNLNCKPCFVDILVQNSVTGCVMALNQTAIKLLKNSNLSASIMHDWYAALIASGLGEIRYISKSTILYRQHETNQLGAKNASLLGWLSSIKNIHNGIKKSISSISDTRAQTHVFLSDFEAVLPDEYRRIAYRYYDSFDKGIFSRLNLFLFHGIRKSGIVRNMAFFVFYVLLGVKSK